MSRIIAFSSKTAWKCLKSFVPLYFMSTNCDSAGVVAAIFKEVELSDAFVPYMQEFNLVCGRYGLTEVRALDSLEL